jgi:MATE family, multidrug efflux pump
MQDLTTGSLSRHLLKTSSFMLIAMVFQTLYVLIDLYWVGRLGTDAVAAVAVSGNLMFLVLAATQMLGVGTTTLVSHGVGRKEHDTARLVFNQSLGLAATLGMLFFTLALIMRMPYATSLSADAETASLAAAYLAWFIPSLALQFPLVAMGAAMRGTGNFKPGMIVQSATIIINIVLAPILIFGWVFGIRLGVGGAALATLIAIVAGNIWMALYFLQHNSYLAFSTAQMWPQRHLWTRMLKVGLPAGAEFGMMTVYLLVVYMVSRPFGASAQAGFGIGMRIIQACFMPVVALGFAVAPVAGQNYGARRAERVKQTFYVAAGMATAGMIVVFLASQVAAPSMMRVFTDEAAVVSIGQEYLRIVSWSYIASGIIFVASSMFQAMGNTIPSLVSSFTRIVGTAIPVMYLSKMPGFSLRWVWLLSAVTIFAQLTISLLLLRREFRRRLAFAADVPASAVVSPSAAVS